MLLNVYNPCFNSVNDPNSWLYYDICVRSVFRSLMELDADMCWFTLNELFCPVTYEPPHPQLRPVTLSGSDKPRNEFTDNVLKLLQEFDSPKADRRDSSGLDDK